MVELASLLFVGSIDCHDELAVAVPPAILLALYSSVAVLSLVHGFSLSLTLVLLEYRTDGLLAEGVACCEVKQLPRSSWFAMSELADECFVVMPKMNAPITSTSMISWSSLHCLEKRRMYTRRVSPAFCLWALRS
jgi:hypothetical protein